MNFRGLLNIGKISFAATLVVSIFVGINTGILINLQNFFSTAEAAVVTLDPTPNTTASSHSMSGTSLVFINDQVGYKFHRFGATPHNGMCVYRKTTNGGDTWGTQVPVDNQTDCTAVAVWYDRWTPGDSGNFIHIASYDTGADEMFYNRLDTANDSLLLTTSTSTMPGLVTAYGAGTNVISVTKATDGEIYMNVDDSNGTFIRSCSSNCNIGSNWANVGTPPQGNNNSWSILMPLSGGDVMLINRSITNIIRSSVWAGTTWTSFNNIDASAIGNATYDVGMSATVDVTNGDIYLAYTADNNDFTVSDHDIRTAIFSTGSWAVKTDVLTNVASRGILQVAIGRDLNNGDIYVGYTARSAIASTTSSNIYWTQSTNDMVSWGSEQGPVNTVSGDMYGINMNLMSNERFYATWFDNVAAIRDVFGNTVAVIGPEITLNSFGSQLVETRNEENNLYLGGGFSIVARSNRSVNTIIISEAGTINAQNNLKNIKLFYDLDTTAPYNCASESYSGGESQFGSTVASGFSGNDGVASFATSPVSLSTTQTMCIYVVADVQASAVDGDTIEIVITDPVNDVLVSGVDTYPDTAVSIAGTTTVVDPNRTQFAYHWRLDNGSEITASSATAGIENTPLTALQKNTPRRLRIGIANQGSTTTMPSVYRLEYGLAAPTCDVASGWTSVDDPISVWDLFGSVNITDGDNSTNISPTSGGLTDIFGTNFVGTNAALRDTNNNTGSVTLNIDEFIEAEFSIVASTSAQEGETYCFRTTRNGTPLSTYSVFPRVTISADVLVQAFGNQTTNVSVLGTNQYMGGGFSVKENSSSRNLTDITISELGTISGSSGVENIRLFYESDTSAPYDCASESYSGIEPQFGANATAGFSGFGETVTFSDSVGISTVSTACLYVVLDITGAAQNTETIDLAISSPTTDVQVSGGATVGPSGAINITDETIVQGAILDQLAYHFRNDDGSETSATSATGGTQNSPLTEFTLNQEIRVRFAVTNTGLVSSVPRRYRLEYAPKITTCDMAVVWTNVDGAVDGWNMYDSSFLTNGETTTDISQASGGVSDGAGVFIGTNGNVRDTESLSATSTIPANDYVDLEYSITSTNLTSYSTTYCFRVSTAGISLGSYSQYAEITTAEKRDYKIQRGSTQVSGTSATLTSGVNYDPVSSSSLAFVRITNAHHTGAGHDTGVVSAQNTDDVTAYISNPGNIQTSFTITRPPAAIANTRVDWEIVEFIGKIGTDNELRVQNTATLNMSATTVVATGTTVASVSDNSKVVVYITGVSNRNASRNFYAGQVTALWDPVTKSPVFRRGANGASIIDISYAVVEYVGQNWQIQRVEHTYVASGVTETKSITSVNSLSRTFLHVQKRMGATTNVVHFGHEVWLSSIGAVSFRLETGASVAIEQTSVAWIVENIQTGSGAMNIQRSNGGTTGGVAPLALSIVLPSPLTAINNTSISATARAAGANTTYPRPMAGFTITSTSTYQIWRSNTGTALTYRVELIEWPVADLAIRQNYYRFYVDDGLQIPLDPWPIGIDDLGENFAITTADEPLGIGERLRLRMTYRTINASMPAGFVNFKMQYALRISTCSAIGPGSWIDLGASGSGSVWRGYSATNTVDGTTLSTNPPTGGDLLISIANRAGSLVHQNPSPVNPYPQDDGDIVEYDWYVEQNGANPQSTYCFRSVKSDGTPLDGYSNYPQIRTAGYTPVIVNWRWYSDINNETPSSPLALESVAPIDIANNDTLSLRVAVDERKNAQGENIKFKLQFSEDVTFNNPIDVASTSTCQDLSLWCYAEGSGIDNNLITNSVLTSTDTCVSSAGVGCGVHNAAPDSTNTHTHFAGVTQEYGFYVRHVAARVNAVYYFRLYDVTNDVPVFFAVSSSYPSLVAEGPTLQLSLSGLPSGTSTAGVMTNVATTPAGIGFGSLLLNFDSIAAHRINVQTNASEGYQLFKFARHQLLSSGGSIIPPIVATNVLPDSWVDACLSSAPGCFGYHATDPTLKDGSTRFAATDTYAALDTSPVEIMYSSIPSDDTHDIVYRIRVNQLQPAGNYETEIVYIAVPSY